MNMSNMMHIEHKLYYIFAIQEIMRFYITVGVAADLALCLRLVHQGLSATG